MPYNVYFHVIKCIFTYLEMHISISAYLGLDAVGYLTRETG